MASLGLIVRAGLIALAGGLVLAACEAKKPEPVPAASTAVLADEAKVWLTTLYAHYTDGANVTFSPLGDQAPAYFDAEMLALMKADEDRTPKDEIGALDGDPICDCQDFGSLKADITVKETGANTVRATVVVNETSPDFMEGTPPKPPAPRTLTYDLVKTPAGWRIHDIGFPQGGSLRGLFTAPKA